MKFSAFVLATAAASASGQFNNYAFGGANPFGNVNFFQGAASPYPVQYQQQFAYPQQQQYVPYPVQQQAVDPLAWERDCTWINSQNFRVALARATCGTDNCVSPQGNGGGAKRSLSETSGFHVWGTVINRAGRVCAIAYTGTDVSQQFPFGRIQSAKKANTANSLSLPKRSAPNFLVSKFNRSAAAFHIPVNRRQQFGWQQSHDVGSNTQNSGGWYSASNTGTVLFFQGDEGAPNPMPFIARQNDGFDDHWQQGIALPTFVRSVKQQFMRDLSDNAASAHDTAQSIIATQGYRVPSTQIEQHMQAHQSVNGQANQPAEYNKATFLPEFNYNTDRNLLGQDNYFRAADMEKIDNNRFGYMHRTNNGGASLNTWDDTAWHGFSMDESPGHLDVHYQGAASNYGEACGNTRQDPMCMQKPGGYDYHAGGLALYDAQGTLRGAIGVAGDNDCANHAIAWKAREQLQMNYVPWVNSWYRTSPVNQLPVVDGANTHFGNVRLNSCPSCLKSASGEYRKGNVGAWAEDNIAFNQLYANPHKHVEIDYQSGTLASVTRTQDYNVVLNPAIEAWTSGAGINRDLTGNNGGVFHGSVLTNAHWVPYEKAGFPTLEVEHDTLGPNRNCNNALGAGECSSDGWNLYSIADYTTGGGLIVLNANTPTNIVWGLNSGAASIANRGVRNKGLQADTPVFEGILRGQPDANLVATFNGAAVTANKVPFTTQQDKILRRGDGPYPYCAVMVSNFWKTNPTKTSLYSSAKPAV